MENATHSHSSMPLVSRLDNLDFILKYLEGKQRLPKCSMRGTERQPVALDLAVREAYFKGSLMERVAFLERRLFQVWLEVESSNTCQTSGYASSSQGSKSEPNSFSLPISTNPHQPNKQDQEAPPKEEEGSKKPMKQVIEEGKTCKTGRKGAPPKWPRLKMLGC